MKSARSELLVSRGSNEPLWELFHENSKLTHYSAFSSEEETLGLMQILEETLPFENIDAIDLPQPSGLETATLEAAIRGRQSHREMVPVELKLGDLASVLFLAGGITRDYREAGFPRRFRTVPSAGAMYPLEIFLYLSSVAGLERGFYYYDPNHRLKLLRAGAMGEELESCFIQPDLAKGSSAIIFHVGFFERSAAKYGERGYRFALIEAGHVAQNIDLTATALGIASVNIGGYYDHQLDRLLGFNGVTQSVIYCTCLGG